MEKRKKINTEKEVTFTHKLFKESLKKPVKEYRKIIKKEDKKSNDNYLKEIRRLLERLSNFKNNLHIMSDTCPDGLDSMEKSMNKLMDFSDKLSEIKKDTETLEEKINNSKWKKENLKLKLTDLSKKVNIECNSFENNQFNHIATYHWNFCDQLVKSQVSKKDLLSQEMAFYLFEKSLFYYNKADNKEDAKSTRNKITELGSKIINNLKFQIKNSCTDQVIQEASFSGSLKNPNLKAKI